MTAILLVPAAASAQPASTPAAPTITVGLSPTTLDYHNQTITVSGTVAPAAPGTSVTVSYTNASNQPASVTTSTDAGGSYQAAITGLVAAWQTITVSSDGASARTPLGFTTDAVSITASFDPPYVNPGSTSTLSGAASYVSAGKTYPLAEATLSITSPGDGAVGPVSTTVTTAADGSFSYVTSEAGTASGAAQFSISSAATPYLQAAQLSPVYLLINQASGVDLFTGSLTPYHQLKFEACAGIGEPLANEPLRGPLDYQYSKKPNGPWKTLGAATQAPYNQAECGNSYDYTGDGEYLGQFTAPLASGYYRAYAPAVPGQMSAVSRVIHLARAAARITGFAVAPGRVGRGGKVAVSGRLWRLTGTWSPDARRQIVVEFRYKNKTYTLKHRLTTDSAGRFRGTFEVPRTAEWFALYNGGTTEFATASKAVTIHVR